MKSWTFSAVASVVFISGTIGLSACSGADDAPQDVDTSDNGVTGALALNRVRFFPRSSFAGRMVGGKFQGSNTSATDGFVDLAKIAAAPAEAAWSELTFANTTVYQYVRYLAPDGAFGNVAELEFYNGTTKLAGTPVGSAGSWNNAGNTFKNAIDGNTSTFYDAVDANGGYVGLDLGSTGTTGGGTGSTGTSIPTKCTSALPAGAQPADVSKPTTVVGTGTPASCTMSALDAAVKKGGVITFNCGAAPVTIGVTSTLVLRTDIDTVIDGGNKVTLDGKGAVQILNFNHGNFMVNEARLTLQHLTLTNAKSNPKQSIPPAPAPCSQGFDDGEGGALYMRDGNLTVIDCTFTNNQAAQLGPDTGGGAIYILGSKRGAIIVGSVFTGNSASNAGAVGALFSNLSIYNSLFKNNTASGNGANNNDPSKCSVINNGQNEVGSGGNGGAIYQDGGSSTNVVLCGVDVVDNKAGAGAFGGGVFMTSNDFSGTITVQDSIVTGNTGGSWTQVKGGTVTKLGTAFGVNAKSASVSGSTLQGL